MLSYREDRERKRNLCKGKEKAFFGVKMPHEEGVEMKLASGIGIL